MIAIHAYNDAGVRNIGRLERTISHWQCCGVQWRRNARYSMDVAERDPAAPAKVFMRGREVIVIASKDRAITALRMQAGVQMLMENRG